jgi:hypothetical protein
MVSERNERRLSFRGAAVRQVSCSKNQQLALQAAFILVFASLQTANIGELYKAALSEIGKSKLWSALQQQRRRLC